jgi:formate hydrogenlyase transcriptional activator
MECNAFSTEASVVARRLVFVQVARLVAPGVVSRFRNDSAAHPFFPRGSDAPAVPEQRRAAIAYMALEDLFGFSPDGILITDAGGVIRDANPRAAELFGFTADELMGMSVEALVPERFRDRHPSHRQNYKVHPHARAMGAALNLCGLRRDGSEFPVDIMLKPMQTPDGVMTMSFVRDMTEQRAAMETVRRQDQQLRSIVEGVRDLAMYLLDRDGKVMVWNPGAERILGYTAQDIIGKHYSRFFTKEDQDRERPAELMRIAVERGRIDEESWRVRKDGSRFWGEIVVTAIRDSVDEVIGFATITRDSTDRKRAEEALMVQLSTAVLINLDVFKLADAISESIQDIIPHDIATIAVHDATTDGLVVQFLRSEDGRPSRAEIRAPLDGSPDGEAFCSRAPLVLQWIDETRYAHNWVRHLTDVGMQSGCWVPVIHRGDPIGVLAVASRLASAFSQREAEMLAKIADQMAVTVVNARAFRQLAESRDRLMEEKQYLQEEINLENQFEDIVGESTGLRQVLKEIEIVAPTDATVLIEGETGTGKELLARAVHRLSPRKERTFIKLNCAAIPATLLESELFGHEKGAFTGANARKLGRLELASEGTLFLDEVGEMPLDLQPKLLRALQEREFERLGGSRPIHVDVRLIAATNRDLGKMMAEKQFRADLYYRLKVFPISAPPLRDRASDIPILARHFVESHSRRMGKHIETIPEETMDALVRWKWPGNIRELGNLIERSVILTRGSVLYVPLSELRTPDAENDTMSEKRDLRTGERERILRALREAKGRIAGPTGAAARLGMKRTTLNSKLKKLGIERRAYA